MRMLKRVALASITVVLGLSGFAWEGGDLKLHLMGAPAEARIGRPLTPLSYAGVARRTSRRVARRTAIRVTSLPSSCLYGVYADGHYYNCGGVYYERSGNTYVQVIIQ